MLTNEENEGYRASKKKPKFYQKETVWLGHTISQDRASDRVEERRKQSTIKSTNKHEDFEILPWSDTIFRKIHSQPFRKDGQYRIVGNIG